MAGYIALWRFTREGLAFEHPDALENHKRLCEEAGIRVVGIWMTMGQYDAVAIYDAPDDVTMARRMLEVGRAGLVTTETLRAFSEDEFAEVLGKMA